MDVFMVIFRLIHVVAGVFWAGAMFFSVAYLAPAAAAAGPEGGRFMQRLTTQTRFSAAMGITSGLTILSGLVMYFRVSGGLQLAWIGTGTGLTLTVGGLAALLGAGIGGSVRATGQRLGMLGRTIESGGKLPTPDQIAQVQALQRRMAQLGQLTALLMLIAVVAMAIARYV